VYVNNDPVNWVDPFGEFPVAIGMLAAANPVGLAVAVTVVTVLVVDHATGGKISKGFANFVESLISPSVPVRDKEGNPIPADSQTPGPTGKGANAGAEDISKPGDLGGEGFKSPSPEDPKQVLKTVAVMGTGAVAYAYYNATTDITGAPKDLTQNKPSETTRPPAPWTEPSFSSASTLNQQSSGLKTK
jgi:hypothetical protein